jgi:hypothetical protein
MLAVIAEGAVIHHFTEAVAKWSHNFTEGLVELLGTGLSEFIDAIGMVFK